MLKASHFQRTVCHNCHTFSSGVTAKCIQTSMDVVITFLFISPFVTFHPLTTTSVILLSNHVFCKATLPRRLASKQTGFSKSLTGQFYS